MLRFGTSPLLLFLQEGLAFAPSSSDLGKKSFRTSTFKRQNKSLFLKIIFSSIKFPFQDRCAPLGQQRKEKTASLSPFFFLPCSSVFRAQNFWFFSFFSFFSLFSPRCISFSFLCSVAHEGATLTTIPNSHITKTKKIFIF